MTPRIAKGCLLLLATSVCRSSWAAEGEVSTGAALSIPFASDALNGAPFWDLELDYGLSESLNLRAEFGAAHNASSGTLELLRVAPFLGLKLDVVEWVPYVSSGPSLAVDPQTSELSFGGELSTGVDYLLSRTWALGAQYHAMLLVTDGDMIQRAGLRLMYRWGW